MVAINFDPIAAGYVAGLSRPEGRITGVVFQQSELARKQVEFLTQSFPNRKRLSILFGEEAVSQLDSAERAAQNFGLNVHLLRVAEPDYNFDETIGKAAEAGSQMVLLLSGPGWPEHRKEIAMRLIQERLPAMFIARHYVEAGGLMSYGADFPAMFGKAADYAAKILNGEKQTDLPIEQAPKFEMVVNLKTAKAIGVELPPAILVRADHPGSGPRYI